jgi:RNA polymerase sigma-70 factor, ECF subfamily
VPASRRTFLFGWVAARQDRLMLLNEGETMNQKTDAMSVENRERMVARARQGDQEALNILFQSCRRKLFATALRILSRPHDAEDAVQEAMMNAYAHLDQFHGRSDFFTWLTRIVINTALAQIRRARSRPVVSWDQAQTESDETVWSGFMQDPKPDPEQIYQQVEHQRLLRDALDRLPARNRRAIQLCTFDDCSVKTAAVALGLPKGTLKVHLHRGRVLLSRKLRSKLQARRKVPRINRVSKPRLVADERLQAA